MPIIKKPFQRYKLDDKKKAIKFPISLNKEDIDRLSESAELLQEEKLGSVIKFCMNLGITTLKNDPLSKLLIAQLLRRKVNNERQGIIEPETNFQQKYNLQ